MRRKLLPASFAEFFFPSCFLHFVRLHSFALLLNILYVPLIRTFLMSEPISMVIIAHDIEVVHLLTNRGTPILRPRLHNPFHFNTARFTDEAMRLSLHLMSRATLNLNSDRSHAGDPTT